MSLSLGSPPWSPSPGSKFPPICAQCTPWPWHLSPWMVQLGADPLPWTLQGRDLVCFLLGAASPQCSTQCLPHSRAQCMTLEWMASPKPSIQGSPGSDLVRVLFSVPLTQLLWVFGLLCIRWCISPWTFCQAALNLSASSSIYWLWDPRQSTSLLCASVSSSAKWISLYLFLWGFHEEMLYKMHPH